MAVNTLQNKGFEIEKLSETNNPVYCIKYAVNASPIIDFSKTFEIHLIPKANLER